ncbi:sulfite exporter TauE/SafE family protein [Catellatospora sp. KI3]|uniref:sulfite exporter TauE/SafE family protein n=1 Tax=Catellatospora sp. KI3 TaxID=3041620 RepID=UPI002482B5E9|nr:sulfite exporter TauE/SafE family protein [Catellatospora sp. KI3]MDI1459541.1 sulfite exporter TauE/SafE family protein [Catellatospora sp. KI3]
MDVLLPALAAAGVLAGAVNAVAGGGSLLVLPALLAAGVPPVGASVTTVMSVIGGYSASVVGTWPDLRGRSARLRSLVPLTAAGALTGCVLLLRTPPTAYAVIMPFLVLAASLLLAFQGRLSVRLGGDHPVWLRALLLFAVGVYGGYFGSVLGVILLAVLGLMLAETLNRLVAVKNVLQLAVGAVTTTVYALFGPAYWPAVAILIPTTLLGGYAGARLGRRLPARTLRRVVVAFGITLSALLLIRALT